MSGGLRTALRAGGNHGGGTCGAAPGGGPVPAPHHPRIFPPCSLRRNSPTGSTRVPSTWSSSLPRYTTYDVTSPSVHLLEGPQATQELAAEAARCLHLDGHHLRAVPPDEGVRRFTTRALGNVDRIHVLLPVPLGPKRKKADPGGSRVRVNMIARFTVNLAAMVADPVGCADEAHTTTLAKDESPRYP